MVTGRVQGKETKESTVGYRSGSLIAAGELEKALCQGLTFIRI